MKSRGLGLILCQKRVEKSTPCSAWVVLEGLGSKTSLKVAQMLGATFWGILKNVTFQIKTTEPILKVSNL